jgi:DNA repair protein RecO (recombination protein O)
MPSEKTRAIVLRVIDFSESSCVVTVLTRDFGKISGLAKGARRPKSPFESALDVLAICRIVFLHKSSEALDLLTEAKLDRRFRAATRDLSRLYAGYYVAELISELTDADDPHPELYDAAETVLIALDGDGDVRRGVLRFEMTALRVLGHSPSLTDCADCGITIETDRRVPFGLLAGGVLCQTHRAGKRQVVGLTPAAVEVLRCFADEGPTWQEKPVDPRVWGEVRGLINQYITHLVGRPLRMRRHLGILAG